MTYGYIRVSSDKQTVENQRYGITQFCAHEGIVIGGQLNTNGQVYSTVAFG